MLQRLRHYLLIICYMLLLACASETNNKTDNTTGSENLEAANPIAIKVISPIKAEYVLGDKIELSVNLSDTAKVDSVRVLIGDKYLVSSAKVPFNFGWDTKTEKVGRRIVNVHVFRGNSKKTNMLTVFLLSDLKPPVYGYKVVKTYRHDPEAYTQGLIFDNGFLYESTGLKGQSSLRKVKIETGEVLKSLMLPEEIFGEGIVLFNNQIIQITWQNHLGFVYEKETFNQIQKFNYPMEGWGITTDGKQLIISDGTEVLYFYETETYTETATLDVYDNNGTVKQINELEYIKGEIWANIYQTDRIARIDPNTGKVLAYIDLKGILPQSDVTTETDVLNGIAYDPKTDRIFVTGKKWDKLFEIKVL